MTLARRVACRRVACSDQDQVPIVSPGPRRLTIHILRRDGRDGSSLVLASGGTAVTSFTQPNRTQRSKG